MELMKPMRHLTIAILLSLCVILLERFVTNADADTRKQQVSYVEGVARSGCLSEGEIVNAVQRLSIGNAESDESQELLIKNSKISAKCRMRVISSLVSAMSKNVEIGRDAASYDLWRLGAEMLGKIKAVEALDLLTSHLALYDGRAPFGDAHRPAAGAVIRMGSIAIPKLYSVLRQSSDRAIRRHAVYCIGLIGGRSALRTLQDALPTESDPCVNRFIRLSIDAFHNEKLPNHITSRDRTKWLVAFMCNE
jgi:HEAT repeat protein